MASAQLVRRLARVGIKCEESAEGVFSIDDSTIRLTYYGDGKWVLKVWPLGDHRFTSKSTSKIAAEVERFLNTRDKEINLLQEKWNANRIGLELVKNIIL